MRGVALSRRSRLSIRGNPFIGGGSLAPIVALADGTFTRSSEASYRTGDASQPIAWAGVDERRIVDVDAYGVAHGSGQAIHMEKADTNIVPESEDLSKWGVAGSPVLTGGQLAPDGETDAFLVEDNNASAIAIVSETFTFPSTGQHYLSCFIKKKTVSTYPVLVAQEGGGASIVAHLDPGNGNITLISDPTGTATVDSFDYGDWYRFRIGFTNSAASGGAIQFEPAGASVFGGANDNSATGSVEAWGFQCVAHGVDYEETYIRTAGAAATRSGDSWVLPAAEVPDILRVDVKFAQSCWPAFTDAYGSNAWTQFYGSSNNLSLKARFNLWSLSTDTGGDDLGTGVWSAPWVHLRLYPDFPAGKFSAERDGTLLGPVSGPYDWSGTAGADLRMGYQWVGLLGPVEAV